MKILMTGFNPFAGEKRNAAQEFLLGLPDTYRGAKITRRVIPTEFMGAQEKIKSWISEGYDMVLCLGQASGREFMTPERIAMNFMDARLPDNAGYAPQEEEIVKGGPAAYFTNLPIKKVTERLFQKGVPVQVSNTAGTYVCNCLFYRTMHEIVSRKLPTKGGFIHVPCIEGQREDRKGMPLEEGLWALLELIEGFMEE